MERIASSGYIKFAQEWNDTIVFCSIENPYHIIILSSELKVIDTFSLEKEFWGGKFLCANEESFYFYCSDSYNDKDNWQTWDLWIYKISKSGLFGNKLKCELFTKISGMGINFMSAQIQNNLLYIAGIIRVRSIDESGKTKHENRIGYTAINVSRTNNVNLTQLPIDGSGSIHDLCLTMHNGDLVIAYTKYSKSLLYLVQINSDSKNASRFEFDINIDSKHHIEKLFPFKSGNTWSIFADIKSEFGLKKYKFYIHRIDICIKEQIEFQHYILDQEQFVVNPTFGLIENQLYTAYSGKFPQDAIYCSKIEEGIEIKLQSIKEEFTPILISKIGLLAWGVNPFGIYYHKVKWND